MGKRRFLSISVRIGSFLNIELTLKKFCYWIKFGGCPTAFKLCLPTPHSFSDYWRNLHSSAWLKPWSKHRRRSILAISKVLSNHQPSDLCSARWCWITDQQLQQLRAQVDTLLQCFLSYETSYLPREDYKEITELSSWKSISLQTARCLS